MRRSPSPINALIALDKPIGMTSHDVVARVRRALGTSRVGHAGTLDPAASGVLVIGVGQATKLLGLLTLNRKQYRATFTLGAQTATDDAEGDVLQTAPVAPELLTFDKAATTVKNLVGAYEQVPPAFSAVSVGGKRAYAAARAGEQVELAPRHVEIFDAQLVDVDATHGTWTLDLDVSKGTYIRSIARDLGQELGCLAHVSALRRLSSGSITLADCLKLSDLQSDVLVSIRRHMLDPVATLELSPYELLEEELPSVMNGRPFSPRPDEKCVKNEQVALTYKGGLVGIWHSDGRCLRCDVNFPQAIEGVRG